MAWISQNIGTIIVCLLLFGIIAAITVSLIRKNAVVSLRAAAADVR